MAAALAVAAMFLISMCAGRFPLSLPQIGEALLQRFFDFDFGLGPDVESVVADNHSFNPSVNKQKAVFIHMPNIAGMNPQ